MNNKRILLFGLSFLCVAGAAFCGWNFYQEIKPRVEAEQVYDQIREMAFREQESGTVVEGDEETAVEDMDTGNGPDFEVLQQWNPDVAGWLRSPGTDIDYPVVQGQDNDYYLNHTADGVRSIIGSIFMESKNQRGFQDDVTVLYGHHIRGGRMFSSLSGYKGQSYYEEHPVLYLYTPDRDYRVELFAGQILDGQTGTFPLVFESTDARADWLRQLSASSSFDSRITVEDGERILALCTCSYEYDDARYVVYGVLRDMEEEQNEK